MACSQDLSSEICFNNKKIGKCVYIYCSSRWKNARAMKGNFPITKLFTAVLKYIFEINFSLLALDLKYQQPSRDVL